DAADQAQRAALAAMERGVGHDARAVEREQRQHLVVVDVLRPAVDDVAVLDRVPGKAPVRGRQVLEELEERVGVAGGEWTEEGLAAVAERDLLRVAVRHGADVTRGWLSLASMKAFLLALALLAAAAAQAQTVVWNKWDPMAVRTDRTADVALELQTSGPV